jgi:hypothetical protein
VGLAEPVSNLDLRAEFIDMWLSIFCHTTFDQSGDVLFINLTHTTDLLPACACNLTADQFMELVAYLIEEPSYNINIVFSGLSIDSFPVEEVLLNFIEGRIVFTLRTPVRLNDLNNLEFSLKQPGYTDYEIEIELNDN